MQDIIKHTNIGSMEVSEGQERKKSWKNIWKTNGLKLPKFVKKQ